MTMKKENKIRIFESKKVRTFWDDKQEKWYLSVVDVIAIRTIVDVVAIRTIVDVVVIRTIVDVVIRGYTQE